MSMWSGLRALFGEKKPKKAPARPKQKTALSPAARAALIKEAMNAHRAGRDHVRDVLDRQLDELRARVPDPGRDLAGSERLLSAAQADGTLKKLMTSDLKRVLALVGLRQRMAEATPRAKTAGGESRPRSKR